MSKNPKTRANDSSVDTLIDSLSDLRQQEEAKQLIKLYREATQKEPVMWGDSIIGFDQFPIKYADGRELDWLMTGFSPRKGKFSLYIMDGFDKYAELLNRLGKYKTGKSCLYVKKLADIDLGVLSSLISASCRTIREQAQS